MNASSKDISAWLSLYLIPGLGNGTFKKLLAAFGTPKAVLEAKFSELSNVKGVGEETARKIVNKQFSSDPEEEIRRAQNRDVRIITYQDPVYPPLLREINSPPMVLYMRGKDIPHNRLYVALVGSRNPTHYGLSAAERIGTGLAARGIGVVSGMAKGIDAAAHQGCLKGKGFTVAVIGTGIDVIYPAENRALSEKISENGVIISEFPLGSPPEPRNFPIRNRIISGLSRGVVVVEATKNSGSLITASKAFKQGRDVFAVPGSINSFKSTGTHSLIKQGAKLVENADDILEAFGLGDRPLMGNHLFDPSDAPLEMSASEKTLYALLTDYPMHIDEIVRQAGMDAGEVSSTLMGLELKGFAQQLMGKRFVR